MAQLAIVVQGAQFTISDDATVRTDQGAVRGSELKDYVRDNRNGWVGFGTKAEIRAGDRWGDDRESECVAWVNCLWIGSIVEEVDGG